MSIDFETYHTFIYGIFLLNIAVYAISLALSQWGRMKSMKRVRKASFLDIDDSGNILILTDSTMSSLTVEGIIIPPGNEEISEKRKSFVERFFKQKEVLYDRYRKEDDTSLARVFNNRKSELGKELIKYGYALSGEHCSEMQELQERAALKRSGIWSDPDGNSLSEYIKQ